jgi:predicted nucleic acid-binding protein
MLKKNIPKVCLDTNVSFDLIGERDPYFKTAEIILELASKGEIELSISSISLTTLIYLSYDKYKISDPTGKLIRFIDSCGIITTPKTTSLKALHSSFTDKEDALQYYTARKASVDYFITRDKKGFVKADSAVIVLSPEQFEMMFAMHENSG